MNPTWMDAQFVLDVYQAFLTLLVCILATFACLGVLASVLVLCLECNPSTGSAGLAPKPHCDIGAQAAKRVVRFALGPSGSQNRPANTSMGSPDAYVLRIDDNQRAGDAL
jgi:hypothetical protein